MTDEILLSVTKPGRYVGNEIHMVKKDPTEVNIRFAFCFPDVYEVGMSHLGLQILYFFLNRRDDVYCERVFMPWMDMATLMKDKKYPLFALETGDSIKEFSFVGFTLQHEMGYTNVLAMLDLAGIPLRASQRGEDAPIICAGGPCAYNPEPMADFMDFFYIGDGEAVLDDIMDLYKIYKPEGKIKFLSEIAKLPGVYVPRFYDVEYNENGTLFSFIPNHVNAPPIVKKARITSLENAFFPDKMLVPLIETVHGRATLELFRGCIHGCRFCQAGFINRPVRERTPDTLLKQADKLLQNTGHEEISLVSLSTSDYSCFTPLLDGLLELCNPRQVNISLPSLRMDSISVAAFEKTQSVRKSSLTFAPEAGNQRLRDVINKNISDMEIISGCQAAFEAGFDRIKLYFMAGLPTEEIEDIEAIAILSESVVDEYYRIPKEKRRRPVSIHVSCSCFVPKPFTPFQWEAQERAEDFINKQRQVKSRILKKQITYRYHDAYTAEVEGILARGDRRVGAAIEAAFRQRAIFDGWTEHFSYRAWVEAFDEMGVEPEFYIYRKRDPEEVLPWDFIDIGISREFLLQEKEKAYQEQVSPNCSTSCANCGLEGCKL